MKVLLSFVFVCFSFLGFGQEKVQLETPAQVAYRNVQLWSFQQSAIIDVEKEIKASQRYGCGLFFVHRCSGTLIFVDGVRVSELPKEVLEVVFLSNGLPPIYGGGFVSLNKNQEQGWY
jgi:hypothetical protein